MSHSPDDSRATHRPAQRLMLAVSLIVCTACAEPPTTASPTLSGPTTATTESASTRLASEPPGEGFVVWESNRSGAWRLWIRDLDGSPPHQLSPEDGERQHCCAHIAPGGERVAFLSLPRGAAKYPASGASGPLHTIATDGTGDRIIYPQARTYFEHRAVVWRSKDELILIDAEGHTRLLDVATGTSRALTPARDEPHGWLVNSSLSHATTGQPSFSPYDARRQRIAESRRLGGCQPYFSHDGRWGFWVAGAGGPIRSIDLASGQFGEILKKSDRRLPLDRGYLYFPMLSHDAMLFAWGASPNQHDHATSDYDIFVAATDPRTLELTGEPWQVTSDPATDRFPDVYSAPLALGRHLGEAPLRVVLQAPDGEPGWQWSLEDGTDLGVGARIEPVLEQAGSYPVQAQRDGQQLLGLIRVMAAQPPNVVNTLLRDDSTVVIHFDEAVSLDGFEATFESGRAISRTSAGADSRSLVVELEQDLDDFEILLIEGVRDLADSPNLMPATRLDIVPPTWPSDPRGLVFLWQSDKGFNEIEDPATGERRACLLSPTGRAWLDRNFAMQLAGGAFVADEATLLAVLNGCRRTNEMTFEATLTPARVIDGPEMARIATFSSGSRSRNFTLGQTGDRLIFRLRTATTGQNADRPQLELGPVTIGQPVHLVVSYTPGRFQAFLDGRRVLDSDQIQDGFFHWQIRPLVFGREWPDESPWHGTLEGLAIYDRALELAEAAENARRFADLLSARPDVERIRLRAKLVRRSQTPSLASISPYRDALAVFEYQVEAAISPAAGGATPASGALIRVAHRVLVDGDVLPVSTRQRSKSYELTIEPFFDHPELESLYLSETLPEATTGALFYSPQWE